MLAFSVAFERWMKANDDEPFPPFADAAFSDLQARGRACRTDVPGLNARRPSIRRRSVGSR